MQVFFPKDLQFHILRHFSIVDENYMQDLSSNTEYAKEEITKQMEMQGSRFFYHFAKNPQVLENIINSQLEKGFYVHRQLPERRIYILNFDNQNYPNGIGTCNIVLLKNLSPNQKNKIQLIHRGDTEIKTILGIEPTISWKVHLVLMKGELDYISTVFPGIYAPPFPDKEDQSVLDYKISFDFWNYHILIDHYPSSMEK